MQVLHGTCCIANSAAAVAASLIFGSRATRRDDVTEAIVAADDPI